MLALIVAGVRRDVPVLFLRGQMNNAGGCLRRASKSDAVLHLAPLVFERHTDAKSAAERPDVVVAFREDAPDLRCCAGTANVVTNTILTSSANGVEAAPDAPDYGPLCMPVYNLPGNL